MIRRSALPSMRAATLLLALCASLPAAAAKSAPATGLTGMWTLDQKDFDAAIGNVLPYTPRGQKIADAQKKAVEVDLQVLSEHESKCLPIGMPSFMANEFAIEILETGKRITMLAEASSLPRTIYLDRTGPSEGLEPMWNGYSVGHWEGRTLVIKTTHLNGKASPITMGGIRSPSTVITEKLHLEDGGRMLVNETTFEDPQYLAKPWSTVHHYHRLADDAELWEYACEIDAPGWSERYAGEKDQAQPKPAH